ncbi:hypothetical protein [Xanthobacter sediminis]
MKRVVVALMALGVAGCAGTQSASSLSGTQATCSQQFSDFKNMWNCIRYEINSGNISYMNSSMGMQYVAFGDLLYEKNKNGQVSDAEARLLLAQELSRRNAAIDAEINAQYAQSAQYRAALGNAISAGGQAYGQSLQQGYNRPLNCTSTPHSSWVGGRPSSVTTTCY